MIFTDMERGFEPIPPQAEAWGFLGSTSMKMKSSQKLDSLGKRLQQKEKERLEKERLDNEVWQAIMALVRYKRR